MILAEKYFFGCRLKLSNRLRSEEGSSLVLTEIINSHMCTFNSNAGISSIFLSSLFVPKKVCKSFTSHCVFCDMALFSCPETKLST